MKRPSTLTEWVDLSKATQEAKRTELKAQLENPDTTVSASLGIEAAVLKELGPRLRELTDAQLMRLHEAIWDDMLETYDRSGRNYLLVATKSEVDRRANKLRGFWHRLLNLKAEEWQKWAEHCQKTERKALELAAKQFPDLHFPGLESRGS